MFKRGCSGEGLIECFSLFSLFFYFLSFIFFCLCVGGGKGGGRLECEREREANEGKRRTTNDKRQRQVTGLTRGKRSHVTSVTGGGCGGSMVG